MKVAQEFLGDVDIQPMNFYTGVMEKDEEAANRDARAVLGKVQ